VCVSLAAEKEAYILGLDSDFLILVSTPGASRVKGYCPLDMMMWIEGQQPEDETLASAETAAEESGWNVAGPKTARPLRQSTFLPPPNLTAPTLVLTSIAPNALRHRLRLPAPVLPLLASIVGNDYTPPSYSEIFFEPGLSAVQKVEKVSRILRETVFAPNTSKNTNAGDQAVRLVKKAITKLAYRPMVNEAFLDEMVNTIIDASFQYILPGVPVRSPTYPFDLPDQVEEDSEHIRTAKERYSALHERGMEGTISDTFMWPGRTYLWTILEDPSGPSLRSSERLREVRRQAWGILEEGCGGLVWPEPTEEELRAAEQDKALQALLGTSASDESEDVEEVEADDNGESGEQSAGEIDQKEEGEEDKEDDTLIGSDTPDKEVEAEASEIVNRPRPRIIVEYVRQGSSKKVAAVEVALPPLSTSATPACLAPLSTRLEQYLSLLSSNTFLIRALPPALHPLLAVTRLSILEAASRATPTRSDPKWKKAEVAAVLKMGLGMYSAWVREDRVWRPKGKQEDDAWPPLINRPVGIMAQLGAVMKEALLLAQTLLLVPEDSLVEPGNPGASTSGKAASLTHLTPFMFVSGVTLHCLMANNTPPASTGWRWTAAEDAMLEKCMEAVVQDIQGDVTGWNATVKKDARGVVVPETGRAKSQAGPTAVGWRQRQQTPRASGSGNRGRYDLLDGMTY